MRKPRYQPGIFDWCNKGEAVFAMQWRLRNLECDLREGRVSFDDGYHVQKEVADLIIKTTRRKSMKTFDLEGFFETQKRFKADNEYRISMAEKIAGTWVDPSKEDKEDDI